MCWRELHTALCLLFVQNMSCLPRSPASSRLAAEQELSVLLITHPKVLRSSCVCWMCRMLRTYLGSFHRAQGSALWQSCPRPPWLCNPPPVPTALQSSETNPSHSMGQVRAVPTDREGGCWGVM